MKTREAWDGNRCCGKIPYWRNHFLGRDETMGRWRWRVCCWRMIVESLVVIMLSFGMPWLNCWR